MFLFEIDKRDTFQNVKSTAQSFRSWDTCMANRTCKIVAIVLIVLGGLIVMWALTTVFQCLFMGAKCIDACCCCCCRNTTRTQYVEKPQQDYPNPNMYPPHTQQRYAYQPQPPPSQAHFASTDFNSNYRGYEPVKSQNDTEYSPFNDNRQTDYRR
ncbi:PSI+ induction protein 2 [Spathaspora sp. JA1]|nr:PSI+ induction protein 2 [Spathaspora sp. JA1]